MPRDTRTYVTLHDGMPDSRKIRPLSDKGFRTYVELLCWCSRELTDGVIPAGVYRTYGTPKARAELVAANLIEVNGDEYRVHDYLEHQRSREQIEGLRQKRAEAGSKGGRSTANREAIATADGSKNAAESESVSETDNQDLDIHPHVPDRERSPQTEDGSVDKSLATIIEAVRTFAGRELHPMNAALVKDMFDDRTPKPPRYPQAYYRRAIERSWSEVQQFIDEKGIAS